MSLPRLGIGVVGFGWMGQAHSRGFRRVRVIFDDCPVQPVLAICAEAVEQRRAQAVDAFGFTEATDDWRKVVEHPDVDLVVVAAPNMLHVEITSAAAAAGKHVFCEKPVGGSPSDTSAAERAVRRAGVNSGVGYNYRWAPLVQYAKQLIDEGRLGRITNYRGRFLSCYGADPLGLLTWRFLRDQAGWGVSTDLLSHTVDLAMYFMGPITSVIGVGATFVERRPLPAAAGTHYDRGRPGDPTGAVTNEDWCAAIAMFASGAHGTFEASRSMVGPESQNALEIYGTDGAVIWDFERMNELQVCLPSQGGPPGFTTVRGGDRFPYHGCFVPGQANGIGFEDLVTIEDYEFLRAIAEGRPFSPGFNEALAYAGVQDALLRSWDSHAWEPVRSLRAE